MKATDLIPSGWFHIVKEHGTIAMVQIKDKFHIVSVVLDSSRVPRVMSVLPCDEPDTLRWSARPSEEGVKSVSSGRSRNAADKMWRKYVLAAEEEWIGEKR